MLSDIVVARSVLGTAKGRSDIHRHATFSCMMAGLKRKVLSVVAPKRSTGA